VEQSQANSVFSAKRRYTVKSRILHYAAIALSALAFVIFWFGCSIKDQENTKVFPATINRDCAPWDGAAFTMSFRYDPITTITISIWQSPDIKFSSTFSFPDETGQVGYAYVLPELDPLQQLSGKVFFWRVEQGYPVEGEFDLITDSGHQFKGKFMAEWGNEIVYCG
jgi:hypothetical protein